MSMPPALHGPTDSGARVGGWGVFARWKMGEMDRQGRGRRRSRQNAGYTHRHLRGVNLLGICCPPPLPPRTHPPQNNPSRTSTACTLWEAPLEDLLPWLLDNTAALDALSARAQRQREALEGAIVLERGAQHAQQAQHTYTPQQAAEACAASGGATAPLAVAQQAAVGLAADGGHDGAATALWAISSSPEPSASQLGQPPAEEAAAHDQLHSAAAAGPAGGGLLQGELAALRQEMVQRLDALAADMRRAMSAASLGQSVAALGGGQGGAGRGGHRASSPGARAEAGGRPRRHHWAFGQITM